MPRNGKAGNHASAAKAGTAPVGNGPRGAVVGANCSRREQSFELPILLDALEAMRMGDFSVPLPRGADGVAGKVAEAFNEIVAANERLAEQMAHLGLVAGREGKPRTRGKLGLPP